MSVLVSFIAFWIVAASLATYRQNKITKEWHESLFKETGSLINNVIHSNGEVVKLVQDVLREDMPVPEDATRVYGALLRNGKSFRLHLLAADSPEHFIEKSQAIVGPNWTADIIEYLDVQPMKEKIVYRETPLAKKKEIKAKEGLYILQYVRDIFAKEEQKATIEDIIKTYKEKYELS